MAESWRSIGTRAALAAATLFLLLTPGAARAANTYYARGGASKTASCAKGDECSLETAVGKASSGDSIVLIPGPNFELTKRLSVNGLNFGGAPGGPRPTIVGPSGSEFAVFAERSTVHDLNILGQLHDVPLVTRETTVERAYVEARDASLAACNAEDSTFIDSVCRGTEVTTAFIDESLASGTQTVILRNDTLVGFYGLVVDKPQTSPESILEATNVIAKGEGNGKDVVAESQAGGKARAVLTHSDYATVEAVGPETTITAAGTNGNVTAVPQFVAAATGNFGQLATSPTVDAGLTESSNGTTDIEGNGRALAAHPTCASLAGPTDIGAYEYVPPAPFCPPPPPPTPTPVVTAPIAPAPTPTAPGTKLGKAKIDSEAGSASFTFSGSGSVSAFSCELVRPKPKGGKRPQPKFAACKSPKAYKHLASGKYTFKVEAKGPGGTDPTPAKRTFHIG